MRTDGRMDMAKIIVAFRNFETGPKKWQNAERLICHYDLFSQIVRLRKATSQGKCFFNSASGSLRRSYSYRRHKFDVKPLLRNITFLSRWQWRVTQQHAQNALLLFLCYNGYANAPQCYVIRHHHHPIALWPFQFGLGFPYNWCPFLSIQCFRSPSLDTKLP